MRYPAPSTRLTMPLASESAGPGAASTSGVFNERASSHSWFVRLSGQALPQTSAAIAALGLGYFSPF